MNKNLIKNILSEVLFGSRICESLDEEILVNYMYDEFLLEKLLIGEPVTLPELKKILNKKIVNFEFIKLDGDVRPAKGTTRMDHIPPKDHPSGLNPSSNKVATFFDLTKGVWRSVSNKSKEIVLIQDKDTGKLKVRVSDKVPKDKEEKPYTPKEPGISKRPISPVAKPIVKPSIKPEITPSIPKVEELPDVEPEEAPLDVKDTTIAADDIKDTQIVALSDKTPEPEIPKFDEEEPEEIIKKEDIIFPPDEEDITFPEEETQEEETQEEETQED